jgi:ribosomal protein S24E
MSLNIEIIKENRNPLVDRTEIEFKVENFGNGTPNRLDVKSKLAAMQSAKESLTIIKKIQTGFGSAQILCTAYIYDNSEELKFFEPLHIQVRNLPKDKRTEILNLKKKNEPYKHLFKYD